MSRITQSAFALALLLAALLAIAPRSAQAQGTVQGKITDAAGEALPGVSVTVEGLDLGAAAGVDGTYAIEEVPAGQHTLRASFVGYRPMTEEFTVADGEAVVIDFELGESTLEMDEVIVTGTGGQARRRELGTSISSIDVGDIESAPIQDFGDMLQGRAAGVTVMDNSGQVGSGSTIRLRGVNSVTQDNSPLIYIDGVRVSNESAGGGAESNQAVSPLNDLNPNDIQRIEVIKGPAATTLYGTEASSGVIQVFTKQGAEGDPRFSLSVKQGINSMGTMGTQDYHAELAMNDCSGAPGCPADGNWFRAGHTQSYDLSVRGGQEDLKYYVSGRWNREEGVIAPQSTDGYSIRGNFNFTPLENFSVDLKNTYSFSNTQWVPDGNNAEGLLLNVLREDKGYTPNNNDALVLDMLLDTQVNHFTTGLGFNWAPTANFLNKLNLGLDYVESEYTEEKPFGFFYTPLGQRENDSEKQRRLTLDYRGSYSATEVFSSNFSSTTSWGGQFYNDIYTRLNGFGYEFAGPGRKDLDSAARTEVEESRITITSGGFFGQERIGWNDQLFLTLGMRVDGFSTFGEDFGLAVYPKVSASYLISDHDFWPDWWGSMKLRGAYGESGKAPEPFDAIRSFESVSADEGEPAVIPGNVGDPDLGPERSYEYEAGFEGTVLDGRVAADFTWYRQRTNDALLNVQPTPSEGFSSVQLRNVGTIENAGLELSLDLAVLRGDAVRLDLGGHYSHSESEAVDLGDIQTIDLGRYNEVREGYPVPSFFLDVVTNPDEVGAEPEFEEQFLGTPYPTDTFGFDVSVTLWNDLTLKALGEAQWGHDLSSGTAYQNVRREAWPVCNDIQRQISEGNRAGLTAGQIGRCDPDETTYGMWVGPGDFFKLRSASLSYELPEGWMPRRVRRVTMRLQAKNLFTITDYPGLDPEAFEDGSRDTIYRQEYYNLPAARSFTFGLHADF